MTARSRQTDKAAKLGLRVELPSGLTRSATRARQGRQGVPLRDPEHPARPRRRRGALSLPPALLMATTAAARRRATASPLPHAGALRQAPHGNGRAFPPASPLPGAQEDS